MASPSLELQGAIIAALKGTSPAIAADRIYDHVPRGTNGAITASFPFVAFANWQEVTDDVLCIPGAEVFVTIDVWSRGVGMVEAHRIAAEVKAALHDAELSLTDNALVLIEHETTRTFRDPDGITSHAVLDFRAFVEIPA
jgi:hypothetical protein